MLFTFDVILDRKFTPILSEHRNKPRNFMYYNTRVNK